VHTSSQTCHQWTPAMVGQLGRHEYYSANATMQLDTRDWDMDQPIIRVLAQEHIVVIRDTVHHSIWVACEYCMYAPRKWIVNENIGDCYLISYPRLCLVGITHVPRKDRYTEQCQGRRLGVILGSCITPFTQAVTRRLFWACGHKTPRWIARSIRFRG
jgi:hypothetical protein